MSGAAIPNGYSAICSSEKRSEAVISNQTKSPYRFK
jgi:hypothetical protein